MVKLCNRCQKERAALKRPKTSEQVSLLPCLPYKLPNQVVSAYASLVQPYAQVEQRSLIV